MIRPLVALLLLPSLAGAAELSLDGAVGQALDANRALAAAGPFEIEKAEARALQAGLPKNPEIEIGGRTGLLFGNSGDRNFSLGVSQSIARRDRLRLARDAALLSAAEQRELARDDARLLVGDVQMLYVNVLGIQARSAARQRVIETGQRLAALVEQRYRAGEVPQTDLAPIQIENLRLAQDQQLLATEKATAEIDLKLALGLPANEPLVLTTTLAEVIARLEAAGSSTEERSDLRAAKLRIQQTAAEVKVAQAERYEDVTVGVDYQNERTPDNPGGFRSDHFLGVKVSIPIPTRNRNQGRIQEQQAAQRQSTAALAAAEQRYASEIARAQATLQQIEPLLSRYTRELVPMAETNYQAVQRAYEQGQTAITQVFQVQQQRSALELDLQEYLTRKAATLVALETAKGTNSRLRSFEAPTSSNR